MLTDRWVQDTLRTVSAMYHQLASVQEANIHKIDKQLGALLRPVEWNMGDLVTYRGVREKNQVLGPQWMGPVRVVNKASPSMYQVEIRKGAKRQEKWFHSSQLKAWKGN